VIDTVYVITHDSQRSPLAIIEAPTDGTPKEDVLLAWWRDRGSRLPVDASNRYQIEERELRTWKSLKENRA
jgi:hypothetical protein